MSRRHFLFAKHLINTSAASEPNMASTEDLNNENLINTNAPAEPNMAPTEDDNNDRPVKKSRYGLCRRRGKLETDAHAESSISTFLKCS